MLRVDIQESANTLSIKLEGRFTGNDAENTRMLVTRFRSGVRLVVDLTEVTFVDSVGEEVLSFFGRFGAEFAAQTSYTLEICERLQICLARDEGSDGKAWCAPQSNASHTRSRKIHKG
jgi:hypothetical protein